MANSNIFKNEWLNFTLYFVQFGYRTKRNRSRNRVCSYIIKRKEDHLKDNNEPIAKNNNGTMFTNTVFLANGEYFKTDFIKVNKEDLLTIFNGSIIINQNDRTISSKDIANSFVTNTLIGNTYKKINPNTFYFMLGLFRNCVNVLIRQRLL